ncbi:MAG: nuclear transport factor 2 family protein [Pacificimonas sp.]
MQYPCTMTRDQMIELATKTYFGNVDKKDMAKTLACFHDNASFCVQTSFTRHEGKTEIERMFADFFDAYDHIVHKDFTCTVDKTNGRIAASFEAVLTAADGSVTRLHNTNFWRIRDDKFQDVHVYMSGENVLV